MNGISFLLAERLIHNFKDVLVKNKELLNFLTFEKAIIGNTFFEVIFSNTSDKVICKLSTHPLDATWSIEIEIILHSKHVQSLNKWKEKLVENNVIIYEVYQSLLNDPNIKGNNLTEIIAADLIAYFKESKI